MCVSNSCLERPSFASRSDWRDHTEEEHGVVWRQGPSSPISNETMSRDPQEASGLHPPADVCPLCCLPLDNPKHAKTSMPQLLASSGPQTSNEPPGTLPLEPITALGSSSRSTKAVRFEVPKQEGELAGKQGDQVATNTQAANATKTTNPTTNPVPHRMAKPMTNLMMMNHIADHLQFLALLTPRLSTDKLDGHAHDFSSSQALSSDRISGNRSTLDDQFGPTEGSEAQNMDEHLFLDKTPDTGTGLTPDPAWPHDEEIDSVESVDWDICLVPAPSIAEKDDKIEHLKKGRADRDRLLEAALDSFPGGSVHNLSAMTRFIFRRMEPSLWAMPRLDRLKGVFSQEITREEMCEFFNKALSSVDRGKDDILVDHCAEQIWDPRPYKDPHQPTEDKIASRRTLFSLLVDFGQPLDILRCIKEGISDLDIPLSPESLRRCFPAWTRMDVSDFTIMQKHILGRDTIQMGYTRRRWNAMRQDDSDRQCLEDLLETDPRDDKKRIQDTKGGLLRASSRWILDNDDFQRWGVDPQSQLLWIKGDPGKGKTMLLCGIIDELKEQEPGICLSYFFCQATEARLNNATAVLRGLIYLLVEQLPSLISYVRKKHDHNNSWEALSQILAAMLNDPSLNGAILIIDALDECKTNRHQLLDFITQPSPVKWIVSSRNLPDVGEMMKTAKQKVTLDLELNTDSINKAVGTYIGYNVDQLARTHRYDKHERDTVNDYLTSNADGTFLWVASVCQELAHSGSIGKRNPLARLKAFPRRLKTLYNQMVDQIEDLEDAGPCKELLAVASVVYRPITLDEVKILAESLANTDRDDLERIIESCGSFLTIQGGVIYFVHQSARDFLRNQASDRILPSGIAHQHDVLFSRSLKALLAVLRNDIYGLNNPGVFLDHSSSPILDPLAAVRYSCVHWVDHLVHSHPTKRTNNNRLHNGGIVDNFIRQKYLHWLESLSLLRCMQEGVIAVHKLEALVVSCYKYIYCRGGLTISQRNTKERQLAGLLQDARRFLLSFQPVIEIAPLQVYASALVFSPEHSPIRELFQEEAPGWVISKPTLDANWNPCLQTLEYHSKAVVSVAFSADDQWIASESAHCTVKVWDAATGECKQTLKGHNHGEIPVGLSVDGQWIVWRPGNRTAEIRDVATGKSTSRDTTDIDDGMSSCGTSGYGISGDGRWITKDEKSILWLPPEYKATVLTAAGSTVAIGCYSGLVLVMKFF